MSKIINENYIAKLDSTLEQLDYSDNLKSMIDFFEEQVKKDQSKKGSKKQKVFSMKDYIFLKQLKESSEMKRIFTYLHKLINTFDGNYLQIHLNMDFEDSTVDQIIFLLIWDALINSSFDDKKITYDIKTLESETNGGQISLVDNNKHRLNQILRELSGKEIKIKVLKRILSINNKKSTKGWLINTNKGAITTYNLSEFTGLYKALDTCLNFGEKLQTLYDKNSILLNRLDTIINLFPSITGSNIWYPDFIAESINEWNRLDDFNFKQVITITSGEKTPESLLDMHKQNKFQVQEIYTIFPFEIRNIL